MTESNDYPLVSIITVVYNDQRSLRKTIESVIGQTYKNIEFIIIDGGSTDGTLDVIKEYEKYINSWISEPDKGVYDAMNKGLKLASGEWINFLNAEDTFYSNYTVGDIFYNKNNHHFKLIYGDWINVNSKDMYYEAHAIPYLNNRHLKSRFQMNHQSLFVKNNHIPNFDLTYKIKADYQWVIDIVKYVEDKDILYIHKPFVKYDCEGLSSTFLLVNVKEYIYLTKRNFGFLQVLKNSKIYFIYLIRYILLLSKKLINKSGNPDGNDPNPG